MENNYLPQKNKPEFIESGPSNIITATDAVYGVLAWLSSQPYRVVLSDKDDAGIAAKAVIAFIESNKLPDVSKAYPDNLSYPKEGWQNG